MLLRRLAENMIDSCHGPQFEATVEADIFRSHIVAFQDAGSPETELAGVDLLEAGLVLAVDKLLEHADCVLGVDVYGKGVVGWLVEDEAPKGPHYFVVTVK